MALKTWLCSFAGWPGITLLRTTSRPPLCFPICLLSIQITLFIIRKKTMGPHVTSKSNKRLLFENCRGLCLRLSFVLLAPLSSGES